MASIAIVFSVGIPSQVVTYSVLGYGGSYNGGVKAVLEPFIDLSKTGAASLSLLTPSWSVTKAYNDNDALPVADKPDWYRSLKAGGQPIASKPLERTTSNLDAAWSVPTGASHGVFLKVDGGNPLLSAAPNIDAEIHLGFRTSVGSIEYMVSGEHDGFPNYQLQLNGKVIYAWDCVAQGETPGALKPPMDQTVSVGWSKL